MQSVSDSSSQSTIEMLLLLIEQNGDKQSST